MNITTRFCREKRGRPTSEYIKKALGRQPNSNTWVMNDQIHIDMDGNLIPVHNQWLGSLVGSRKLTDVALSSDAALVTDGDPYESCLQYPKKAVNNNFVAAFTVLRALS